MAHHVYKISVDVTEGIPGALPRHLEKLGLITGFERDSIPEHDSRTVVFFLKVPNKRKFERYFKRRFIENGDPVNMMVGTPIYITYKTNSKKKAQEETKRLLSKVKKNK